MVKATHVCTLLISLGSSQAVLASEPPEEWGKSGDWSVLVDETVGNGCFIQKDFDDGIRIRLGYVPDREGGFFTALSQEWQELETGETGIAKFISERDKFAGEIEFVEEEGWYGGWAFFNNPEFATELAQRRSITVIGPNDGTIEVDLAGSAKAISEAARCQSEQEPS